ncbi:hypothetical protein WEI85_26405 [Actinomycetes bacterium KLBMP 9797]
MARDVRVAGWVALTSVDDVPDDYVYWLDDSLALPITPGHDRPHDDRDIAPVRHKAPSRALVSREWSSGAVPEAFRVRIHRGHAVPLRAIGLAAVALAVPAMIYGASASPEPTALPVPPRSYVTLAPVPEESTVIAPVVAVADPQRAAEPAVDDPAPPPTTGVARPANPPAKPPVIPPQAPPAAAPVRVAREAEAAGNIDRGSVAPRRLASGGTVMGWIGHGRRNTLAVTGLRVPADGRYRVTVHYATAERRQASVRVNSGTWLVVDFPSTGGWDSIGTVTVDVPLAAGDNTLEFGNAHYWAPDLDRVVVTR